LIIIRIVGRREVMKNSLTAKPGDRFIVIVFSVERKNTPVV